jgi:flagellar FliL protein
MAGTPDEQPKEPRNLQKLFGFLFAGLNIAVLGAGLYLVYASTLGVNNPSTTEKEAKLEVEKFEESLRGDPVLYAMEPFNTNLDGVPRRLVRAEVHLEMLDEEGYEEVINKSPQARDSIMRILSSKTFNDVETVQGKLHLKNQIMGELNGFLEKGIVKNVYFSEFVVQ